MIDRCQSFPRARTCWSRRGLLHPPHLSSGVIPLSVSEIDAKKCADFLSEHWESSSLLLYEKGPGKKAPLELRGFASYPKTFQEFDTEEQRLATLMVMSKDLKRVRVQLPGFLEIEVHLTMWLQQRFGGAFVLWRAHVLRQGPDTLRSTGFSVHQDTEENKLIKYTVVVKLTFDEEDEAPSSMRVVGVPSYFTYGPTAGASGCFLADLYHASVPWGSNTRVLAPTDIRGIDPNHRNPAGNPGMREKQRKHRATH